MKRLRILTGRHVGACLDLAVGRHSLGDDPQCDIVISDWAQAPAHVDVAADGSVVLTLALALGPEDTPGADAPPRPAPQALVNFEPRTFQSIVLCAGPADAPWPADLALLGTAFEPATHKAAKRARQWALAWTAGRPVPGQAAPTRASAMRPWLGAALLGASAVVLTPMLMTALSSSKAAEAPQPTLPQVRERLHEALRAAGAEQLNVVVQGDALRVTGLLDAAAQAPRVQATIAATAGPFAVQQHFTSADALVESIRSAVGVSGAQIKHLGQGRFSFTADVKDSQAVRDAIDRVAHDLAPLVQSIELALESTEAQKTELPILSAMTVGRVSVVQTRDGRKHIVVGTPESTVSVADALSVPNRSPDPGIHPPQGELR
jgi:type III secretion protein D